MLEGRGEGFLTSAVTAPLARAKAEKVAKTMEERILRDGRMDYYLLISAVLGEKSNQMIYGVWNMECGEREEGAEKESERAKTTSLY